MTAPKKKTIKKPRKPNAAQLRQKLAEEAVAGMSEEALRGLVQKEIKYVIDGLTENLLRNSRREVREHLEATCARLLKSREFKPQFEKAARAILQKQLALMIQDEE